MIQSFRGKYLFLSNFYMVPVFYDGIIYPSSEHAYQAAKTTNQILRKKISKLSTPSEAKAEGKKLKIRKNWDEIKIAVMRNILLEKFVANDDLRKRLIRTEDHDLIEGNNYGDVFWGMTETGGRNELGISLMWVRDKVS